MALQTSAAKLIEEGKAVLGIELGSTRIKSVLIGPDHEVLASGAHNWENQLVGGLWSYSEQEIWSGLQASYADLASNVEQSYEVTLRRLSGLGISAMMHGYIALDSNGVILVPFRTWRNTNTNQAVEVLSRELDFNIPHRWSGAHLYQSVLNEEEHLASLDHITTLAGLIHEKLSGKRVLGVGDASGMFPIDSSSMDYDQNRLQIFQTLLKQSGFNRPLHQVLPKVLVAGADAGTLTPEGAKVLDPTGTLQPGCQMCPPEGDAATGMVATNTVSPRTGNLSAGTSLFAMIVLEKPLSKAHPKLDLITTPAGTPVAMVHSNNGTSEWDQWAGVFHELAIMAGAEITRPQMYDLLYDQALQGDEDGGGLLAYNFLSGEPVLELNAGRPLFTRQLESRISLPNFLRTQLMAVVAPIRVGMDILVQEENVTVEHLFAHGGLFKTPVVGQQLVSDALDIPVSVSETASEGGAWGIALLAQYRSMVSKGREMTLTDFLKDFVFAASEETTVTPRPSSVEGFNTFLDRYLRGLPIAETAGECF